MPDDFPVSVEDDATVLKPGQDLVLQDQTKQERLRLDAAGAVRILTGEGETVVLLEAAGANLWLGGSGKDGDLVLFPASAEDRETAHATAHLSADDAAMRLGTAQRPGRLSAEGEDHRVELDGSTGRVRATGQVDLRTAGGQLRVRLNADGTVTVGGGGSSGRLFLRNAAGEDRILMNGDSALVTIGGDGTDGQLWIRSAAGDVAIKLNGATAAAAFGTAGSAGELFVKDDQGENIIVLNGATGNVGLGRNGNGGELVVKDDSGADTIVLRGSTGNVALGRNGNGGDLHLKGDNGDDTIVLRGTTGNVGLGRIGLAGNLFVKNDAGDNTIHLSGQSGDILLFNADCAEEFAVCGDPEMLTAGTVMVIGDDERLQPSRAAYDRRVAGVLSGAGACRPGIVLGRQPEREDRLPLALMGKVYCSVDAGYGPVAVGDLLTTSDTPGYAMRASDPLRAFGAVIGKALQPLPAGHGLIPILIALQ